jgi:ribosomal protein L21E
MQANVDFVEKNNVEIGVGLSNGIVGTTITPMVHDSIIAIDFSVFEGLFNILIGVTSSSYNVPIASTNQQKIVLQVPVIGSKD